MTGSVVADALRRPVPLLQASQTVGSAVDAVLESRLPALPVVDDDGRFVGVFGERELIHAAFPQYFETLGSASFVPHSLDLALERGAQAATEPVSRHMTTDHVEVGPEASDAELAETFLHHRVLIVPVVEDGQVTGIITRADFFRVLAGRLRDGPGR